MRPTRGRFAIGGRRGGGRRTGSRSSSRRRALLAAVLGIVVLPVVPAAPAAGVDCVTVSGSFDDAGLDQGACVIVSGTAVKDTADSVGDLYVPDGAQLTIASSYPQDGTLQLGGAAPGGGAGTPSGGADLVLGAGSVTGGGTVSALSGSTISKPSSGVFVLDVPTDLADTTLQIDAGTVQAFQMRSLNGTEVITSPSVRLDLNLVGAAVGGALDASSNAGTTNLTGTGALTEDLSLQLTSGVNTTGLELDASGSTLTIIGDATFPRAPSSIGEVLIQNQISTGGSHAAGTISVPSGAELRVDGLQLGTGGRVEIADGATVELIGNVAPQALTTGQTFELGGAASKQGGAASTISVPVELPDGFAISVAAGQQLILSDVDAVGAGAVDVATTGRLVTAALNEPTVWTGGLVGASGDGQWFVNGPQQLAADTSIDGETGTVLVDTQQGGTFDADGHTLTVVDSLIFSGGFEHGMLATGSGGTLTLGGTRVEDATISSSGTVVQTGTASLTDATLDVQASSTWKLQARAWVTRTGGTADLEVAGVLSAEGDGHQIGTGVELMCDGAAGGEVHVLATTSFFGTAPTNLDGDGVFGGCRLLVADRLDWNFLTPIRAIGGATVTLSGPSATTTNVLVTEAQTGARVEIVDGASYTTTALAVEGTVFVDVPSTLQVNGPLSVAATGTIEARVAGADASTFSADSVDLAGASSLAVDLSGPPPAVGTTIPLITSANGRTGTFGSTTTAPLVATYTPTDVVLEAVDPPEAVIERDGTVVNGWVTSLVTGQGFVFDGSSSTGRNLSYAWSPAAFFDDPTAAAPTFRSDERASVDVVLTVTDGAGRMDTAEVTADVAEPFDNSTLCRDPISVVVASGTLRFGCDDAAASAGSPVMKTFTFSGWSRVDVVGDPSACTFENQVSTCLVEQVAGAQLDVEFETLAGPAGVNQFGYRVACNQPLTTCSETDGTLTHEAGNPPKAVIAPVDNPLAIDEEHELDGTGSFDPDGGSLTFSWSPTQILLDADTPTPRLDVENPGFAPVTLTVTDEDGLTDTATVELRFVEPIRTTGRLISDVPNDVERGESLKSSVGVTNTGPSAIDAGSVRIVHELDGLDGDDEQVSLDGLDLDAVEVSTSCGSSLIGGTLRITCDVAPLGPAGSEMFEVDVDTSAVANDIVTLRTATRAEVIGQTEPIDSATGRTVLRDPVGLRASTSQSSPGGDVEASASDLLSGSTASFTLESDPVLLAEQTVASDGTVTATLTIPAGVPAGPHRLVLRGTGGNGRPVIGSVPFTVLSSGSGAGTFRSLPAPRRIVDTRSNGETFDGQLQATGQVAARSTLRVPVIGRVSIPADATAVVLNVTVARSAGPGFATIYPCDAERPTASNLNFRAGQVIPNLVVATVGADGDVCVYSLVDADYIIDVSGYFPGTSYIGLPAPQRLLDSRPGQQTADGQQAGIGIRPAGSTLTLPVAGRVGIPNDADAVVLNVTAVGATAPGFATVYPCDRPLPTASNLNYQVGETIPNAVVARLDPDGNICLFTRSEAHYVVDVAGLLPATTLVALDAPQRILETRPGRTTADGALQGVGLRAARSTTTVPVAGRVGVPDNATAVVLNVTTTQTQAPGFATVSPRGESQPLASNLNYGPGQTIPNAVVAKLGVAGEICLFTLAAAHYVIDVTGYLVGDPPPATGPNCEATPD